MHPADHACKTPQDTDSVMCILNLGPENRQNMAAHMAAAQKLADDISKTFPPPVELEWEKVG